jgi:hypothetical protein
MSQGHEYATCDLCDRIDTNFVPFMRDGQTVSKVCYPCLKALAKKGRKEMMGANLRAKEGKDGAKQGGGDATSAWTRRNTFRNERRDKTLTKCS